MEINGNITIEYATCNLCGSRDTKLLFPPSGYSDYGISNVVRCNKCGLIYQNHRLLQQKDSPDKLTSGKLSIFQDYVQAISPFRKYNRILDVGSGEGFFLKLCLNRDWDAWGVEIRSDLVESVKKNLGDRILYGRFEEIEFPENFFDAVTFFNVLDHFPDPYFALGKAYRILRPGGVILIRTANATFHVTIRRTAIRLYRLWKRVRNFDETTFHLYSFNKPSINRYLRKVGFQAIITMNGRISYALGPLGNHIYNKKIIALFLEVLVEGIRHLSGGHYIIGPALSVKATKPEEIKRFVESK